MTRAEQKEAARQFYYKWNNKGQEDEDDQSFWLDILQQIFGITNATDRIQFQKKVVGEDGNIKRIDAYIPETKVLIEQKSRTVNLDNPQPGHAGQTPYMQAKRYNDNLPYDEKAKWIVVSNFKTIRIYDMNQRKPEESMQVIYLDNLQTDYVKLEFLFKKEVKEISKEMQISKEAGDIIGEIYDALLKRYKNPESKESLRSLNALCVRLVFCMYAEDAGLFGENNLFSKYMRDIPAKMWHTVLKSLFVMFDTKEEERDGYDEELEAFPYVNGGLFSDQTIEIPSFTDEIVKLIIEKGCDQFDWKDISPTIFGALFESTLNQETRRKGGMHYTSIENIHKVIDPLFLDDLNKELEILLSLPTDTKKNRNDREVKLRMYQKKLASLTFLDPACGSGNFLTETYLSLRRLENRVIRELFGNSRGFVIDNGDGISTSPIMVKLDQFYGIEINDFAVTVAKTALWIAESQMMAETEEILYMQFDFLPLKSFTNIVEGNSLRTDWNNVVSKNKLSYIIGNPPFVGARVMSASQKEDVINVFSGVKNNGDLDYVACWYQKATDMMKETTIRTALVSTNSITQGEQVAILWETLFQQGVHIDFAHKTFIWDSEATLKAHVHCVIVGFSVVSNEGIKKLYDNGVVKEVSNINGYLIAAPNVSITRKTTPLCEVPDMYLGGQALDDGNLILSSEEKDELIRIEPQAEKYIRPYMMGKDFIQRNPRYCLWLVNADPSELKKCKRVLERVERVRDFRLLSKRTSTYKSAETPTLFTEAKESKTRYIALPKVSSENRQYIPMDYLTPDIIPGDKLFVMEDAELYHFGILTSNVHMAWMRAVAGRLKSDYSYSNTIVYNNFPWPSLTAEKKTTIEHTAQMILDARAKYPNCSLADLYDKRTMPIELRKAHIENDKAVMRAYGFNIKEMSEADCVATLMKMYQELVSKAE